MASPILRILSDLHYGDRASALRMLPALAPVFDGAAEVVFNGDTLDTRPSRDPAATAALRAKVIDFIATHAPPALLLTGNHDPDISDRHALELADRRVFVTHGDILFDDLVPWGRDADALRRHVAAEFSALSMAERKSLAAQLAAIRRAAAAIPQRHQSERNRLKYLASFVADTVWPPLRVFRVLRAWREAPARAAALVRKHELPAQFFVMGHTHHVGMTRTPGGLVVLNTGSFCPPCAGAVVDVSADRLALRSVEFRHSEFRLGRTLAEFALARD